MSVISTKINSLKKGLQKNRLSSNIYTKLFYFKTNCIERKVVNKLKKIENYSEKDIFNLQNKKLLNILKYAYYNTEYYKNLFDDNNININCSQDLKKIPFLSKEIIKNNPSALISKKFSKKYLSKKNTGGSTGEPLVFYSNTHSGLIDYGHHTYLCSLMGHKKGDVILACGGFSIPQELRDNNVFWKKMRKGNSFGDYIFSVLYLNDANISIYIDKLIKLKPNILRGYPSFFDSIANYILKNEIELNFKIKGIILTAEMCSKNQQENIEKAFSSMVYFEYGHTEISLYCYTKDNTYTYQSSPIYGYIEVLNDDDTETKIGEIGNIVATGFINTGMPFIRYRTGDLAKIVSRNGGVVQLKPIYGRLQDYIISKNNVKTYLTSLIFGQHFQAFSNIEKWQIIQDKANKIEILIIKGANYSQNDELEIYDKIRKVVALEITFKYVNSIPITKGGKHLFLKQNIKI
ncbi:MAG: hypothetical protein V3U92_00445 [Cellulophaga sp.]